MPIERKTKPMADGSKKGAGTKTPANERASVSSARDVRSGGKQPVRHTVSPAREEAKKRIAAKEAEAKAEAKKSREKAKKPDPKRTPKNEKKSAPTKKKAAAKKKNYAKPQLSRTQKRSIIAIACVLALAGILVGGYFLTKVKSITVAGNMRYPAETVINRSGLYTGKNIFAYDLGAAKKRIEEDPYLVCSGIRRVYPSGLEINVTERREFAAVAMTGGNYCVIDDTGYVLSVGKRESLDGLLPIYGLSSMGFSVGTRIDMDKSKLRPYTVMEIIDALGDNSYKIREIDISNASNVKLVTKEGVTVFLGDSVDIASKIQRMFNALAKVDPERASTAIVYVNTSGTTDLSYPTAAPTETPEPSETDTPAETAEPGETDAPEGTGEPEEGSGN